LKTRLFNDNGGETYTDLAINLAREVDQTIKPLVEQAVAKGYSIKDYQYIFLDAVNCLFAETRIIAGIKERKVETINYQI
jgi:hypothetical protein